MRDIRKWLSLALAMALMLGAFGLVGCTSDEENGEEESTEEESSEEESGDEMLSGEINVEGSDTLVNMAQTWAEEFMGQNPDVVISVKGGGSGTGIASLINGTVDFADASRQIKDEEIEEAEANGVTPVEHEVAADGIAVIVNPANGVTELSLDQIGQIFRGEVTDWSELGGDAGEIVVLSRDSSSGTYEYFKESVVDPEEAGLEYSADALLLPSNQAIAEEVAANEAAIGYIGVGYVDDTVAVIAVDGVQASVDSVMDGTYPISRFLYMYSDGDPEDVLASYLDWILGSEGQAIVEEEGFVPLP
jgi:phosphate transport system substrate-binding protein